MGPHQSAGPIQSKKRRRYSHSSVQGLTGPPQRDALLLGDRMLQAGRLHGCPEIRGCTFGPRAYKSPGQQAETGDRGQTGKRRTHGPCNRVGSGSSRSCYFGNCPAPQKVDAVVRVWNSLPSNGKPRVRPNGKREWTVIAGVILDNKVVAVASGVKAVLAAPGTIADMHAEILVLRAFSRYILDNSITGLESSSVELVISHPPCGDASISLVQWDHSTCEEIKAGLIRGRSGPHILGSLRTKPGRADSPKTLSKSCSDKLCLRQINGCISTAARKQCGSVYLSDVYAPVLDDYERCLGRWSDKHVQSFRWHDAPTELWPDVKGEVPCVTSVVWTAEGEAAPGRLEVLCNGIKQGAKKGSPSAVSGFTSQGTLNCPYPVSKSKYYPPGWYRNSSETSLDSKSQCSST